ncbi:polyadenylation factor subunit 2 [Kwoniella heveanensis BCC8398]|uniref:Polyadenylation factor subunit 2 n=1 Tax=Kwoniella heveanensis BCC8398 TaxID=1296120 RepID=A0A1B9GUM0_9TREE|nr:polyadenylation factor subunit 2 [Kwoniella heveanensis BCC8398]
MVSPSAVAGPSQPKGPDTWHPTKYLEPNHPDNEEVLEQAAYQAAVTRQGGDDRKRKIKPRRAVDYQGAVQKWRMLTKMKGIPEYRPAIHPNPSDIINLLPAAAHRLNPSTSICDQWVHTSINKERSPTRVVRWTPDARRLLTGNDKGQFTLWNGSSFNYESITQVHDDSIRSFTYSHNGQALVSTDKTGTIKYFTPHLTNIHGFQGHREACHGVSWSPNDERFVSGGDDGLVKIWSYREAREEKVLSGHGWDVRCVDWHPTKGLVASGSKDMLVKFWDPRTGKDLSTLHSHKSTINTCNWSPDGHLVATAGGDGVVRLFDIRTFRELEAMKGHSKEINCLEWHPIHHSLFVSGDAGGTINHYSLTSPTPSEPITSLASAHEDAVFSLSFHPLGHVLCSGSKDFTARFWQRARPVGGHENDRWHLGEERAMGLKMEMESGSGWGDRAKKNLPNQQQPSKDEEIALPGLSNLVAAVNAQVGPASAGLVSSKPTSVKPEHMVNPLIANPPGLPGLGAYNGGGGADGLTTQQPLTGRTHTPPVGGAGAGPGQGVGFQRTRAPLPSQGEMLRQNAQAPGSGSAGYSDGFGGGGGPAKEDRRWNGGAGGYGGGGNGSGERGGFGGGRQPNANGNGNGYGFGSGPRPGPGPPQAGTGGGGYGQLSQGGFSAPQTQMYGGGGGSGNFGPGQQGVYGGQNGYGTPAGGYGGPQQGYGPPQGGQGPGVGPGPGPGGPGQAYGRSQGHGNGQSQGFPPPGYGNGGGGTYANGNAGGGGWR